MIRIIIDRLEGDVAAAELPDGEIVNMPAALLPEGAKEGSVVEISLAEEDTKEHAAKLQGRLERLIGSGGRE